LRKLPERLPITPQVLAWARETAGLSLEEAATKLSVSPNRLAAMEAGEVDPTRKQVDNFARVFRRPMVAFFLRNPPAPAPPVADFRTTQGEVEESQAFLLRTLLRDIDARQSMLRELLEWKKSTFALLI
jgi:transcriptional regulator with XRE-family HTH domain